MLRGLRLKECRIKKGLTQEELGDLVGVSKSAICCYERETRNPAIETVMEFMNIFGESADYLLGTDEIIKTEVVDDLNHEYRTMSKEEIAFIDELRKDKLVYEILLTDPKRGSELVKKHFG